MTWNTYLALALFALCAVAVCSNAEHQESESTVLEGWGGTQAKSIVLPTEGACYGISGRVGSVRGNITVLFGNGKKGLRLNTRGADMPRENHHWQMTAIPKDAGLTDGAVQMTLAGVGVKYARYRKTYYIRPDIHFYIGDQFKEAVANWKSFLPASKHVFRLEARRRGDRIELWMDGIYFTHLELQEGWSSVVVTPSDGAEISGVTKFTDPESDRFLPLDIGENPRQGRTTLSDLILDAEAPALREIPLRRAPLGKQVDVGLARWLRQAKDSSAFYDPYYKRSAWDNIPESIIFRIPRRFYTNAYVLCAVDPNESPIMGVRIGRYRQSWDGSGMTQGDTNVRLDPKNPKGLRSIEQVGTVKISKSGKEVSAPLYLAVIPLKMGEVADYLQWKGLYDGREDWGERLDHFMLEFTRELRTRVTVNSGIFEKKPLGPRSGVHILAVTLEKAPVEILITSSKPGLIFYKHEKPALTIETVNPSAKSLELRMTVRLTDFDGKERTVEEALSIPPGSGKTVFDLSDLELGWYRAEFTFTDQQEKIVWEQTVTFALLPPDTRKAGNESPFGTWWFKGSHYTEPHADKVLPIIQKMGFRHVTPPRVGDKRNKERGITPENFARYKITPSMCARIKSKDPEKELKKFFNVWPDTRFAMIFHETRLNGLGIELPPEVTGGPPFELPEPGTERGGLSSNEVKEKKRVQELRAHIEAHAKAIRSAAPHAKIILGNGGTNFNVFWLREKLPRDLWDCIGMEMAVQTLHPEGQPTGWNLQSLWIANRMKEICGYEDMPTASCYEFDYRPTAPGALTLKRQADWYARDVLHCLAYRLPSINVAGLMDCNSSYYTSRWGSTGVCFRSPLNMPKPSFVSLATLTLLLDQAQYQRYLDTSSTGIYCLEFRRDHDYTYAIWAGRGKRPMTLTLKDSNTHIKAIDSMCREVKVTRKDGNVALKASESPCYLISTAKVANVSLGAPEYEDIRSADATVLDDMKDASKWRIVSDADEAFQSYCAYKPMVKGDISLSEGDGSLKLTMRKQPGVADIIARYAILEPAGGSIPVKGRPDTVGVWVKGNANWGRVYFELEDAKGRRWTSNGWGESPGSWDMSDWQAETAINHDGWRFVWMKLPDRYPSGYYKPSFRHWRCQGDNSKHNQLAYPLKFARLYVVMREKLVYVTDMVPAKGLAIEIKGLAVGVSPKGVSG